MKDVHSTTTRSATGARPQAGGRLIFPHGVANLTIHVDHQMEGIYRGEFQGPKPTVVETPREISIDYPRFNPLVWGRTSARVWLSPAVAWRIEIRGGVAHCEGDLRQLELDGVDVLGGANEVNLLLPKPTRGVRIHLSGGASHLTLRRPAGVAARIQVGGGASKLGLDDQYLGAVGGPIRLVTPNFVAELPHYEVEVGGGASQLTVAPA